MSIARKIAYNAIVNAVTKVASTALALVAIGFITRYLGTSGFGNYSLALTFFSLFGAIADFGLYSVATREISRRGADAEHIMGNVFSLRLLVSSVVLVFSALAVGFLPYEENVKVAILFSALGFFFSSSYSVLNGIFQKNLVMDRVGLVELGGKIIQVLCVVLVVRFNLGFLAVMGAFVFNMIFNFLGVFLLSKRFLRFTLEWDFAFWKRFMKEAFPVGISAIVTFLYFKFDTIILSLYQSSEAVGIYGGAYKIIENVVFFPGMVIGLVLPLFSKHIFEEREKFDLLANKIVKVFALLVFPLVVGVWFTAKDIMLLIGGSEFLPSGGVLQVLIISLGFIFFGNVFNAILLVGNKQKVLMYVLGVCAVLNITLNLFIIPTYSYMGAAFTSVVTEACVVLLSGWLCYRYIRYVPRVYEIGKIFFSVLMMGTFLFFFQERMNFFLVVGVAVSIYVLGITVTRAIDKKEIMSILRSRGKGDFEAL